MLIDYLEDRSTPVPESGCRLWDLSVDKTGYGKIKMKGKHLQAHRVAWEAYRGPIPEGKLICHKCDVPSCINPNHLYVGTFTDNNRDTIARGKGYQVRGTDHGQCKLTEEQVYEIRDLSEAGVLSQREIGTIYNISRRHIYNLKNRNRWQWLPEERR